MEKLLINADDFIGTREIRANLTSLLNDIKENNRTIVVTTQGKPAGVLLSVEGYLDLLETIDDLQDEQLLADIAQARKDFARGDYVTLEEMEKERKQKTVTKKKGKKRIA